MMFIDVDDEDEAIGGRAANGVCCAPVIKACDTHYRRSSEGGRFAAYCAYRLLMISDALSFPALWARAASKKMRISSRAGTFGSSSPFGSGISWSSRTNRHGFTTFRRAISDLPGLFPCPLPLPHSASAFETDVLETWVEVATGVVAAAKD